MGRLAARRAAPGGSCAPAPAGLHLSKIWRPEEEHGEFGLVAVGCGDDVEPCLGPFAVPGYGADVCYNLCYDVHGAFYGLPQDCTGAVEYAADEQADGQVSFGALLQALNRVELLDFGVEAPWPDECEVTCFALLDALTEGRPGRRPSPEGGPGRAVAAQRDTWAESRPAAEAWTAEPQKRGRKGRALAAPEKEVVVSPSATRSSSETTAESARTKPLRSGSEECTTAMLRNIPNKYTREGLVRQLDEDFVGEYDFLYLPIDFKNRCNMGYAFVNFRTTAAYARFTEAFDGVAVSTCLPGLNSRKVCEVTPARVHGFEENVRRLGSSKVMLELAVNHPEWMPLIFDTEGVAQPFLGEQEDGARALPAASASRRPPQHRPATGRRHQRLQ